MFPNPKKKPVDLSQKAVIAPPPVDFDKMFNEAFATGDFSGVVLDNTSGSIKDKRAAAEQGIIDSEAADSNFIDMFGKDGGIATIAGNLFQHPWESTKAFGEGLMKGGLNAFPYIEQTGEQYTQEEIDKSAFKSPGMKAGASKNRIQWGDLGDKLYKEAWVTAAQTAGGLSDDTAESLFDAYMGEKNDAEKALEGGGDFTSFFIPFAAVEKVAATGLAYAVPKFVKNHQLATQMLSQGLGGAGANQIMMGPDATAEQRLDPVGNAIAFGAGAVFPLLGPATRGIKNVIFRNVEKTKFADGAVEPVPAGGSKDSPVAVVTSKDGSLSIATNNIDSVRNYLKASGKTNIIIEEKLAGGMGEVKGVPVTAKHTFNLKTGLHTITVTNSADAQTIAHEWGHYINDEVAKQVRGLSTYLFDDATRVRNVKGIEDTLRSLATKQLADEGLTTLTPEMLDNRMTQLISSIRSEVRSLSSARPDPRKLKGEKGDSEMLSDATAVTLTGESANRRTNFFQFMKEAGVVDDELVKALRASNAAAKIVDKGAEKTALEVAKVRQEAATTEKLGMSREQPPARAVRPSSKFEKTKSENEEFGLKQVPQRATARTEQQINGIIATRNIPGKNIVEINIAGKKPVTMVVHEIDRNIIRAIQTGGEKGMRYVVRQVMKEFAMTEKGAEAYISKRFKELAGYARSQADDTQHVLVKAVRQPGGTTASTGAVLEQPGLLKPGEAKMDAEGKPVAKEEVQPVNEVSADRQDALDHMRMELETAEAGYRTPIQSGDPTLQSGETTWIGVKSSFPEWVPEGARSRKMLDKVLEHMKNGTEPGKRATKERELFDIVQKRLDDYEKQFSEANRADTHARQAREESMMQREQDQAILEYNEKFSGGKEDGNFARNETPPSEAVGFGAQGEGRLRVNLDRMETGKKPAADPFRAEKMTDDAEEEIFLNTKILPKITGKERIGRSDKDIVSQAEMSKLTEADALNMLKERYGALTPDTRRLFEYGMERMRNLKEMLKGREASELSMQELNTFKQEYIQATQLFEVYSGARTEASNLLRSFRIASESGENDVMRALFEDLKKAGIAQESDTWQAMVKMAKTIRPESKADKAVKGILSAWLSGPATYLRNLSGTLSNIATEVASRAANPKTMKEVPTMVSTLLKNWGEGFSEAGKILRDTRGPGFEAFDPTFQIPTSVFAKKTMYDKVTESVGRWLNAADIAMVRPMQKTEGVLSKIYSPKMSAEVSKALSETYGLSTIYRGLPKGNFLRGATQAAERLSSIRINKSGTIPGLGEVPIMKPIIPFVRTIGNVIDRQLDYLPIVSYFRSHGKFIQNAAEELAARYKITDPEQIGLIAKRMHDQQMGRMYLGMTASLGAAALAADGRLSGNGPLDYNERLLLERTGWRRNSIKIGNVWVPYTYLGPLAIIFNMAGNIHDGVKYENADNGVIGNALSIGLVGFMRTQLNASFFKGTSDLLNAISGDTDGGKYLSNLGASLTPIPAAYTQTLGISKNVWSRIVDDPALRQQYETKGYIDKLRLKLGIPGSVMGLPAMSPKSDMFGEPMTLDVIYGLTPTVDKSKKMPVESLLISRGVAVTIPSKGTSYKIDGEERKLTPNEYTQFTRISGQYIYEALLEDYDSLVDLTDMELQDRVEAITRKQRARARLDLF